VDTERDADFEANALQRGLPQGSRKEAFLALRYRTHDHHELHKPDDSAAMLADAIKHEPGAWPGFVSLLLSGQ